MTMRDQVVGRFGMLHRALAPRQLLPFAVATPGVLDGVSALTALEETIGRRVEIVQVYQPWGESAHSGAYSSEWKTSLVTAILARGSVPLITWEPKGTTAAIDAADATTITGGGWNAYLDTWIAGVADVAPTPVYLRPWHEMNDPGQPYGVGGTPGNTPVELVAAWQYVVDRFVAQACTNVRWVWTPNEITWLDQVAEIAVDCYPGDAYVDVVGIDAYNWGSDRLSTGGWRSPRQVLERSYRRLDLLAPDKPIWISETACSPNGGDKDDWLAGLTAYVRSRRRVRVCCWFNYDNSGAGEADWRCTTPPEVLAAYQGLLRGSGSSTGYPPDPVAVAPTVPVTPRLNLSGAPLTNQQAAVSWGISGEATILAVVTVNAYEAGTFYGCLSFAGSSGDDHNTANGLAVILYGDAESLLVQRRVGVDELDFTVPFPLGTKRLLTVRFANGECHVRIDGLHAARDSYDSADDFVPANYATGYRLVGDFAYNPGNVTFEALVAYDVALAENDLAGVEAYLMAVHGVGS